MIETMPDAFDGLAIARQRIAEEAEARTGFLDLGGLGLSRASAGAVPAAALCGR